MIVRVHRYCPADADGTDPDHVPVGTVVPEVETWYATDVDLTPLPVSPLSPLAPASPLIFAHLYIPTLVGSSFA